MAGSTDALLFAFSSFWSKQLDDMGLLSQRCTAAYMTLFVTSIRGR
jgi:hypothetical protein